MRRDGSWAGGQEIAAAADSICAIKEDQTVVCWGIPRSTIPSVLQKIKASFFFRPKNP